jgi:hypothetical protein
MRKPSFHIHLTAAAMFFVLFFMGCAEPSSGFAGEPTGETNTESETEFSDTQGTEETDESSIGDSTIDAGNDSGTSETEVPQGARCEGHYLLTQASELSQIQNCREITGSLTFNGVVFDELDLPYLQFIGESLFIHEIQGLTNLQGLSSLVSVGKHFRVTNCFDLTSLDGLEKLEVVGDELYVTGNPSIINIDALRGIQEVPGRTLHVSSNASLENIHGLENLTRVGGSVRIWNNPYLVSLAGLENLTSIGETADSDYQDLDIRRNTRLAELDALAGIESIYGHLRLETNNALHTLDGLSNLVKIGQGVTVTNNYYLPTCEAEDLVARVEALEGIGGEITIDGNNDIHDCDEVPEAG